MKDSSPLLDALKQYELALKLLNEAVKNSSNVEAAALQVLTERDATQSCLVSASFIPADCLIELQGLDRQLREHRPVIVRSLNLEQWRSLHNPPEHYWWWYFEPLARFSWLEKRHPWLDRLDWLWTFLSLFALTLAFTIVLNTLNRVVGEGLNTAGMLPVVIQILLTIAGGTAALTSKGRDFIKSMMARLRIPKHYWAEASALLSGLVLAIVASIFTFYIPQVATQRHAEGVAFYGAGQFDSALQAYQQAIALQPDFVAAHYSLGVLQEDLQRTEAAIAEYQLVTRSDPDSLDKLTWLRAHNNLGRLYILNEDYDAAWTVLERAKNAITETDLSTDGMQTERYNLLKNLGWVWLEQGRLIEADESLLEALDLDPQRPAAYCLRAQVLEGLRPQDDPATVGDAEIRQAWENCLVGDRKLQPEEAAWAALARERLVQE